MDFSNFIDLIGGGLNQTNVDDNNLSGIRTQKPPIVLSAKNATFAFTKEKAGENHACRD